MAESIRSALRRIQTEPAHDIERDPISILADRVERIERLLLDLEDIRGWMESPYIAEKRKAEVDTRRGRIIHAYRELREEIGR